MNYRFDSSHKKKKLRKPTFPFNRQTHHQHSSHTATGHHSSGTSQSGHIDTKYADNVNGHDTLTDFVTFVCQETDNSPQSSQVNDTIQTCFKLFKKKKKSIPLIE